jgi:hypothetical protein
LITQTQKIEEHLVAAFPDIDARMAQKQFWLNDALGKWERESKAMRF